VEPDHLVQYDPKAITARGDEAGMSRMWGGIHFPSDIEVGLALGQALAQKVVERDQTMAGE
jgi:hypothetical protein